MIFSVWFDGACGEGPNGLRQEYDWDAYNKTIRELQPDAVISVCGPDVRWCGNEAEHCRKSEWRVVPAALKDVEKIEEKSQKIDDGEFSRRITSTDEDLGSREAIRHAGKLVWYPAEVNTSIRPEWFYHPEKDGLVKSVDELMNVYYSSVGGNATFLLNIPPDRRGLLHENDVKRLFELGTALRSAFKANVVKDAIASASESLNDNHSAQNVLDPDKDVYWRTKDGTECATITLRFPSLKSFDKVVLMEHIASSGQRIEAFTLKYEDSDGWKSLYKGTVVGYKKICLFDKVTSLDLRLKIEQSRWYPTISMFEVFCGEGI